jgi:hypothetical protein
MADLIAASLSQAGHQVLRLSEQDSPSNSADSHWIVAPHEFFYRGQGVDWPRSGDWIRQSVMINLEQPQTPWFSQAFHFLRHARYIFDINVKSAAFLNALGLSAYWLPLGYLASHTPLQAQNVLPAIPALASLAPDVRQTLPTISAPLTERPIDLFFVGSLNERRETFFAHHADWLSQYHCFLHMPPLHRDLQAGKGQALSTDAVVGLSRRSKILLNLHRDDLAYFEWHRLVMHGLWHQTLVVSEPCHDVPGLIPGEHFIACPLERMPETIHWLLHTPEGLATAERVRRQGHQALQHHFDATQIFTQALSLVTHDQRSTAYHLV